MKRHAPDFRGWSSALRGLVFVTLLALQNAGAKSPIPRVLMLFSHDRLLPASIELEEGFRERIAKQPSRIDTYSEFLDVVRFPAPEHAVSMNRYLVERYESSPPDVIVAIGPQSLNFLAHHRAGLFPDTPCVITGFNETELKSSGVPPGVVGRPMIWTVEPIFRELPKYRPDIHRLHLVAGAAPFDKQQFEIAFEASQKAASGLTITSSVGEEIATLRDSLARLPDDTIIIFLSYFRTPSGTATVPRNVSGQLTATASVPMLGLFDSYLGNGITGVCASSFYDEGVAAADLVVRILGGESPDKIGILPPAPPRFVFDARQLERWRWGSDSLPPSSILRYHRPRPWWQQQKTVLTGGALLLIQSGLIASLFISRRRQKHTAAELRRSDAGSPTAITILRQADGRTIEVNPAWESITGIARANSLGKTPPELGFLTENDSNQRFAEFLDSGKRLREFEQAFRAPDGKIMTLSLAAELVELHGEPCYVVMAHDVTGRHKLSEARRQILHAARLAQLGEITASISHEINQPLSAILSNTEAAEMLIKRADPPLDELRKILADIRRDDLRASQVIQRVRALVSRQELRADTIDVNMFLKQAAELIARETKRRGVDIMFDISPELPPLAGDRGQLEQALLNLLLNAMDSMTQTPISLRQITLRARLNGPENLQITVSDRGGGIAIEDQDRLFESFFSTKERGLGLGLALVHAITELHGGRASAENNASGGADFHLYLPLSQS
ncbi:MAG: ATP-binding protein [Luteolibacter sp.]